MGDNPTPWLTGLESGGWTLKDAREATQFQSLTESQMVDVVENATSLPQRILSAHAAAVRQHRTASRSSTSRTRNPLVELSQNETNGTRGTVSIRKASIQSDTGDRSVLCGTVQIQPRSKSSSPRKGETLEWQRRLLHGQVGYNDHTDLFGPSGLENIFVQAHSERTSPVRQTSHKSWLRVSQNMVEESAFPSSPPIHFSQGAQRSESIDGGDAQSGCADAPGPPDAHLSRDILPSSNNRPAVSCKTQGMAGLLSTSQQSSRAFNEMHIHSPVKSRTEKLSVSSRAGHEDLSPVFVSKYQDGRGNIKFAALDNHELEDKTPSSSLRPTAPRIAPYSSYFEREQECDLPSVTAVDGSDLSLSEDLPTGTPPMPELTRFVESRRGGYSDDESFRRRPLSPSPEKDNYSRADFDHADFLKSEDAHRANTTATFDEENSDATLQGGQSATPPPNASRTPLKLFGPHDTFTSNQLLRRLGQLDIDEDLSQNIDKQEHLRDTSILQPQHPIRSKQDIQAFGKGGLSTYAFDTKSSVPDMVRPLRAGRRDVPSTRTVLHPSTSLDQQDVISNSIQEPTRYAQVTLSKPEDSSTRVSGLLPETHQTRGLQNPDLPMRALDQGKRPPNSPTKCPTPKRRRTLHITEMGDSNEVDRRVSLMTAESTFNRKHKDGKHGERREEANSDILAARTILRPRSPMARTTSREQIISEVREATEDFFTQQRSRLDATIHNIETSLASDDVRDIQEQAELVASEVAEFTMTVSKPSAEYGVRKRSVTTQDFLNEAIMVMNLIRAKARPQSGLSSLDESDVEGSKGEDLSVPNVESLKLSRPPSRDGRHSGWRSAKQMPTDARVISHLRKFREIDDDEDEEADLCGQMDNASDRSGSIDHQDELEQKLHVPAAHVCTSRESLNQAPAPTADSVDVDECAIDSYRSTTSANQTICTNASRKSDNVGTLGPDAVAHLIGEQVGTMIFDSKKRKWIRAQKTLVEGTHANFLEPPSQATSDDDPFREISDLPIDKQREQQSTRAASFGKSSRRGLAQAVDDSRQQILSRPDLGNASETESSGEAPDGDVRECDWTRDDGLEANDISGGGVETDDSSDRSLASIALELVTRNIKSSTGEHRTVESPARSPLIASDAIVDPSLHDIQHLTEALALTANKGSAEWSSADESEADQEVPRTKGPQLVSSVRRGKKYSKGSRSTSLIGQIMALDCHDESELSLTTALPGDRIMNISLSVTKPTRQSDSLFRRPEVPASSPYRVDQTFYLSDLPDFTVHDDDEERPSERHLAARVLHHSAEGANDRYALATRDLVKTLTDIQPNEPYWEDLTHIDVQRKSLVSLYGLEDFCCRIQDLNISHNAIAHLRGIPSSVRDLKAVSNQLTDLATWNDVPNLQYLDISSNRLSSLHGLRELFHLRELIADNNGIEELTGLEELDGLLTLQLRANRLDHADFASFHLKRLQTLDLSSNMLRNIHDLPRLQLLECLKLDDNKALDDLQIETIMPNLTTLSLKNCSLSKLSVVNLPKLRFLLVDDNSLEDIDGLVLLTSLEVLSMRRQKLPRGRTISILERECAARVLLLSENASPSLLGDTSFLNLQVLELASAGLRTLPPDIGVRMPNLNNVNLNFNSLSDLRPLLNIHKLSTLRVCGNQIDRLRRSVATLARMPRLGNLDLRDNPMTKAFYAHASVATSTTMIRSELASAPLVAMRTSAELDSRYLVSTCDTTQDEMHVQCTDDDTRLRRRVYETMLVHSCPMLTSLDGLVFDRTKAARRDGAFEKLVELGILQPSVS